MTLPQQKEFERSILQRFISQMEIPAVIVDGDFEAPDAAIDLEDRRIGVEITEIQKSSEDRAMRATKDDVVARAQRAYELNNEAPINLLVSFNPNEDFRKVRREAMAGQIVEVLKRRASAPTGEATAVSNYDLPAELRPWIKGMWFWQPLGQQKWQIVEASSVESLTVDILQARVNAKANRLAGYRQRGYTEYWLLICAHPTNPACRFEPHTGFEPEAIQSPFDRTFFFDAWHCIELGLRSP